MYFDENNDLIIDLDATDLVKLIGRNRLINILKTNKICIMNNLVIQDSISRDDDDSLETDFTLKLRDYDKVCLDELNSQE